MMINSECNPSYLVQLISWNIELSQYTKNHIIVMTQFELIAIGYGSLNILILFCSSQPTNTSSRNTIKTMNFAITTTTNSNNWNRLVQLNIKTSTRSSCTKGMNVFTDWKDVLFIYKWQNSDSFFSLKQHARGCLKFKSTIPSDRQATVILVVTISELIVVYFCPDRRPGCLKCPQRQCIIIYMQ